MLLEVVAAAPAPGGRHCVPAAARVSIGACGIGRTGTSSCRALRHIDRALAERIDALAARRLKPRRDRSSQRNCRTASPRSSPDGSARSRAVPEHERAEIALTVAARVLDVPVETGRPGDLARRRLDPKLRRLLAVEALTPTGEPAAIPRPLTPLRDTVLMTNAPDQPSVGREIAAEIAPADRIDAVLAFIRWTGVRDLLAALRRHTEAGRPLRIITTTYTGTTELRAVQALVDAGAEVKVSYDTTSTRLHAKAWCFHRATGFSTVYIGSSNLTFSAQVTGREWNVRASQQRNPDLVAAFERVFETYWADPHLEPFDPERFAAATARAADDSIDTPFSIEPYPFQRQILEKLEVERRRGDRTTWSWPPPAPARQSWPHSTTGGCASASTGPGCCSSPTVRRSSNE